MRVLNRQKKLTLYIEIILCTAVIVCLLKDKVIFGLCDVTYYSKSSYCAMQCGTFLGYT